jgi:opacity protein-like surface antigen
MIKPFSALLFGTALAGLAAAPLRAADYDPPIVVDEAPEFVPVEVGSGWYLRGDVGYSVDTRPNGNVRFRTFDGAVYTDRLSDSADLSDNFSFGVGFGYSFTDMIRADVTLDRLSGDSLWTEGYATPCATFAAGTSCRSEATAEFTAYSALLNGYVDLGTIAGITPYVGAGVGYTYMSWDNTRNAYYCVDGTTACPAATFAGSTTHRGASDWRFTYALMAGASYDLTDILKLDLGYRYRRIDGGDMFGWDAASTALGATGVQGQDDGLASHEVRVGVRLELW